MTDYSPQLILSVVFSLAGVALVIGTIAAILMRARDIRDEKNKKPWRRMMVAEGDYGAVECPSTFCTTALALNQKIDMLKQQRQTLNDNCDVLRLQRKQLEDKLSRAADDFHLLREMARSNGAASIANEAHASLLRLTAVGVVETILPLHDVKLPA